MEKICMCQGFRFIALVSPLTSYFSTIKAILHHLMDPSKSDAEKCEFIMEVTDKTRADVKVCIFVVILENDFPFLLYEELHLRLRI